MAKRKRELVRKKRSRTSGRRGLVQVSKNRVPLAKPAEVRCDLDMRVYGWNEPAEHLFGFSCGDITGTVPEAIIPKSRRDESLLIRERVLAGERIAHFKTSRLNSRGDEISLVLTAFPDFDESNRIIGVVHQFLEGEIGEWHHFFSSFLKTLPGAVFLNRDLRVLTFPTMTGRDSISIVTGTLYHGQDITGIFAPGDQNLFRERSMDALSGHSVDFSADLKAPDHRKWRVQVRLEPVTDQIHHVSGLLLHTRNPLTLSAGESNVFHLIPGENPNPVLQFDDSGKVIYSNTAGEELLYTLSDHENSGKLEQLEKAVSQVRKSGVVQRVDIQLGDSTISFDLIDSSVQGLVTAYGFDITDMKRVTRELQANEIRFRQFFEQDVLGIAIVDMSFRFVRVNQAFCNMVGRTAEELTGRHVREITHPEDSGVIDRQLAARNTIEKRYLHAGGGVIWARVTASMIVDPQTGKDMILAIIQNITAEKNAYEEKEKVREQYRLIAESATDMISRHDIEGKYLYASPAATRIMGYKPDELAGHSAYEFFHPDDLKVISESHQDIQDKSVVTTIIYRLHHKQGRWVWVETTSKTVTDPETGDIQEIIAITRDISERKKTEQKLIESEQRFRDVSEAAGEFIYEINNARAFIYLSNRAETILGYATSAMTGMSIDSFAIEEDRDRIVHVFDEARESGRNIERLEFRCHTRAGKMIWLRLNGVPMWDGDGKISGFRGAGLEITESKLAYEAMKQSEKKYRDLYQSSSDGIVYTKLDGTFIDANQAYCDMLGYTLEELKTLNYQQLTPERWHQYESEIVLGRILKDGFSGNYEKEYLRKDGTFLPIMLSVFVSRDEKGEMIGMWGIVKDISQLKQAQTELLQSQQLLSGIIENTQAVIYVKDPKGTYLLVNKKYEEISGKQKEDILGQDDAHVFGAETARELREIDISVLEGKSFREVEETIPQKDGKHTYISLKFPMFDESGEVTGLCSISTDITQRKMTEKELRLAKQQAESLNHQLQIAIETANRLAREAQIANNAKSEFIANISHEIRTPLNAILGFSDLLRDKVEDPVYTQYINAIKTSGRTLLSLINDILDLSKIEAGRLELILQPMQVRHFITDIEKMFLYRVHQKGLEWEVRIDERLPETLLADEVRLRQILFNLIGNAIKFTRKGRISLRLELVKEKGNHVDMAIHVEDTGIGIPEDQLETIFEAFRQQRGQQSKYGGTGLGLTITRRLTEIMGGRLQVASEVGRFSRFTVHLPNLKIVSQQREEPLTRDSELIAQSLRFPGLCAMVVDDVAGNRELLSAILEVLEMKSVEFSNGEKALQWLETNQPDVIFLDLKMPEIDGFEMTRMIKQIPDWKAIPVIITTASAMHDTMHKVWESGCNDVILKPFTRVDVVRSMMRFLPYTDSVTEQTEVPAPEPEDIDSILAMQEQDPDEIRQYLDKEVKTAWEEIREGMFFARITEFSAQTRNEARKRGLTSLEKWTRSLDAVNQTFDIERIREILNLLPEVLRGILDRLSQKE